MGVHITVVSLYLLFGAVAAKLSMVELTRDWKQNFGWEVVCSWQLYANDSLQSVRLYKSDQQFLIYRPEVDGPKRSALMRLPTSEFQVDCYEDNVSGVTGKCVMTLEILQPMKQDLTYTCEVSGERPTFRSEAKTIVIDAFVPPSDAVIEPIYVNVLTSGSGRVSVNCTSTGVPAPTLVWTIGDQKIPAEFSGSGVWNFTSKLYDVWSSLSYIPDGVSKAVCTPESLKGSQSVKGLSAEYNSAQTVKGTSTISILSLIALTLTR